MPTTTKGGYDDPILAELEKRAAEYREDPEDRELVKRAFARRGDPNCRTMEVGDRYKRFF